MRIAISGTHSSGKSTLVKGLADALPTYSALPEPYDALMEEGHVFAEAPSVEDFEAQLERSIEDVEHAEDDVIFDRCPIDFLGYLLTHPDAEAFDLDGWLPRIQSAIRRLDLIVFLPVEARTRNALPLGEDVVLRMEVDAKLKEILLDDPFDLDADVLELKGAPHDRLQRVLAHLRENPSNST